MLKTRSKIAPYVQRVSRVQIIFFFSSRRRHTRLQGDWSSDVCSSDLPFSLRIEKGHIAGPELDGRTTADDLGLGSLVSTRKDFIGRRLSQRPALRSPEDRKSVV